MNNKQIPVGGFPILGVLGLIFVTLKLTKVIDWSWWYVTLPFWGFPAAVFVVCFGVYLLAKGFLVGVWAYDKLRGRGKSKLRRS
jgi:uncharacterized membrane protein